MTTEHEAERLRRVYATYRAGGRETRLWAPGLPGNRAMAAERHRVLGDLLRGAGLLPLAGRTIVEVGCGSGDVLAGLQAFGARPRDLHGVDLLPDRIAEARAAHPDIDFALANAERLPVPDASADVVLAFTVFSSILDPAMAARVAGEMRRILRPDGAVVWYDFRWNNPRNPHVRGLGRRAVRALLPGFEGHWRSLTLLPPLARRLGRATPRAYPLLAAIPALRTHWLAVLRRPRGRRAPSPAVCAR